MTESGWLNQALLSVAEMYRADAAAIAGGVPGLDLMEAAGAGVAAEIAKRWSAQPVAILTGPGNNGGDGFVVARLLAEAGWDVRLGLLGSVEALEGDAAALAARWPGPVGVLEPVLLDGCGLVVDAVFGAGLARDVGGIVAETLVAVGERGLISVAVDIPSGVSGDSGDVLGCAAAAALTVTFCRRKPGHLLLPGRELCGEIVVIDIGIADEVVAEIAAQTAANDPQLWLAGYPWPETGAHKYGRGHAVVVSGGPATTGAARLAAGGALRSGAGLVTVAGPPAALIVNATQLTAIMTASFDGAEELTRFLAQRRRNAVLLGPGNGVGEETRDSVLAALAGTPAVVLDADALTSFAEQQESLFAALRPDVVLTPHGGEFVRLFPDLAAGEAGGKLAATRAAAARAGAVVLHKGPDTVIAEPGGRAVINSNAPPELATAGSGDVLAGFVLGLVAQGLPAFEAAAAATWLHGAAATAFGPGLIAEDLETTLPKVLRQLQQKQF